MEDIDNEIDVSNVFKQAASNLVTVSSLDDSLNRFGYSSDDRIDRRELVLMYSSIKGEMETEISHLAHDSAYDDAKKLRSKLTFLKSEFSGLQTSGARLIRDDQLVHFEKASGALIADVKRKNDLSYQEALRKCEHIRNDIAQLHDIQLEKLEKDISKRVQPHMKYSKRLIELFKAESGLIKLNEYEEARKVRNMIDKILPIEERRNKEEFETAIQNERNHLKATQKADLARMDEKLKSIMFKDERARDLKLCIEEQRIKNHKDDMNHTHTLESKLRPEMSVKPSALWQKRKGYSATSSSLRGQQLLDCARGKKEGDSVFTESLVDKHNFLNPPMNTTRYRENISDDESN